MKHKYAEIIINISLKALDRPFTYRIPEELADTVVPGSLVEVPFGAGNTARQGYVIGFADHTDYPEEGIKPILRVLGQGGRKSGQSAIALAAWIRNRYGSTMSAALKTVLTARRQAKPVESRTVVLGISREEAEEKLAFFEKKHQVARARVLESLLAAPCQPYQLVIEKLHITPQTIRALKEAGVLNVEVSSSLRNPVSISDDRQVNITLNEEQLRIVDSVTKDFADGISSVSLIHGITGSGKTEVYISIIENIVKQGASAIMLIPEIALTYQTLLRFYRHFGDRVSVMNSSLSESEKSDQYERARRGEIDVIIGPRSALFTPFARIGVIVIDEEHENSYKNESMPKYHARDVAIQIAKMHGGVVVLGSATPSLNSYFEAESGNYRLFELHRRASGGSLPEVFIADMRKELAGGNRSILSGKLRALLEDRLEKGEQTMLFLNRRGFSGFVSCRSCGYVVRCPHCDVALSLHRNGRMICHYCGHQEPAPKICPECGSRYISGFRAGTEQVEAYLAQQYPSARILRMDADTTSRKGSYEKILSSFANEEADILIGTQMIVKGHDFPKVTLVGILLADLSLYANDYRAAERTFQLLTQAAGRAGRAERPGSVVIQTYEPENYALVHAAHQDYEGFYEDEIGYRRLLKYPPVCHMLAVQIASVKEDHALAVAGTLREVLDRRNDGSLLIIGPASAALGKLRDEYRYVLYIKCPDYDKLIECKDEVQRLAADPEGGAAMADTGIQFDFDPVNPY